VKAKRKNKKLDILQQRLQSSINSAEETAAIIDLLKKNTGKGKTVDPTPHKDIQQTSTWGAVIDNFLFRNMWEQAKSVALAW
jgi:hypothetical protein